MPASLILLRAIRSRVTVPEKGGKAEEKGLRTPKKDWGIPLNQVPAVCLVSVDFLVAFSQFNICLIPVSPSQAL